MAPDETNKPRALARRIGFRATLLALAYMALGQVSARFVFAPLQSSAIWLPSGLALAVLVRAERRHWPLYGAAIFLAEALPGFLTSPLSLLGPNPLPVNVMWGLGNTLGVLTSAWLLRAWPGLPMEFRQVRDVAGLMAALTLGNLISATLGVSAVALTSGRPLFGWEWLAWYLGDELGGLMIASWVLAWVPERRWARAPPRAWELGATLLSLTLLAHLLFGEKYPQGLLATLPYASFPLIFWMAFRHGPRGATLGSVVLGVIAALHTARGRGPFANMVDASRADEFLSLHTFVAVLNLSALTLAALVCEHRQAEKRQRGLSQASAVLAGSMDERVSLPRIAGLLVPELVTGFAAWRQGPEGRMEQVAQAGLSPAWQERLRERMERLEVPSLTWEDEREGGSVLARMERHGKVLGGLALVQAGAGRRVRTREVAFAEDLAHRCALALENARLLEETEEAIHLRDEFIPIAAHELKTPLTTLKLYLRQLAASLAPLTHSQKALSHLQRMARQASRLSQLVENLLDAGHLDVGRLQLERGVVELGGLARELAERLSEDLHKAHCELALRIQGPVTGWWDRTRLEQVVLHLLGNALKFGAGHPIELEVSQREGWARLVVRDQGIGMTPEVLERIFGRFERAVSSSEYGGLGLGLFLARKIVEAHGGSIQAASQPGEGTTLTLELPAFQLPAHAGEPHPQA